MSFRKTPPSSASVVPHSWRSSGTAVGTTFEGRRVSASVAVSNQTVQDIADPRSYQTGLLFPDGHSKPALQAFKLPFWAQAQQSSGQTYVIAWGQVRPDRGPQSVALEVQRPDGSWHTIPSIQANPNPSRNCPVQDEQFLTDENGFYLRILPYQGVLTYRARWMRSDGGTDYAPPITVGVPAPA